MTTGGVDQLAKRVSKDGRAPRLRFILVDMIEEYAWHTGHADLIRESIDGLVGEDPARRRDRLSFCAEEPSAFRARCEQSLKSHPNPVGKPTAVGC